MASTPKEVDHGKLAFLVVITFCFVIDSTSAEWLNHGGDRTNSRSAIGEVLISPGTINNLKLKWKFLARFDITATPAVANGVVYFPSWNGNLYAVNARNGGLIWQQNLTRLTGLPLPGRYVNVTVSRSTPVVADDLLLVGIYGPAVVIAVRRLTGALVWKTQLDPRPYWSTCLENSVRSKAFGSYHSIRNSSLGVSYVTFAI